MKKAHGQQDEVVIILDEPQWSEFLAAVDAGWPTDNPGLRALLARKPA